MGFWGSSYGISFPNPKPPNNVPWVDCRYISAYSVGMNMYVLKPMAILMVVLAFAGCQHGKAKVVGETKTDPAVEALRAKLGVSQQTLLPELTAHTPGEWGATPHGAVLLKWAREADAVKDIPETTYTLYRRFRVAGERPPYEGPYFEKRQLLTRAVLSAWVEPTEERLNRVNDLLWNICEETTWVVPAHEKKTAGNIDLFASETAADLAHVLALLGDKLKDEVRARVREEVNRRVLDPYLRHAREYSWGLGRNNWTGVCAGSIGQTFLLMEDDPERLAQGLTYVIEQLDNFIAHAFEEDGGCLEGIGYWNYGLIHFVGFAEMLRDRTKGAIDLMANPKLGAIARYPLVAYLGNGLYASFADAHEHSSVRPFLAARFAERHGASGLLGLVSGGTDWRLSTALRDLAWWSGEKPDEPVLEDVFLPHSGIARFSAPPFVLAIKAGHNDEPHNHNDVGSFVLAAGGQVYLCDPGGGLYDASYFGPKRYDNVFANSYGHSVPRIGGALQSPGKAHCGTIERTGDKGVRLRFEKAYDVPGLVEASRTAALESDALIFEDQFTFSGDGKPVEEVFLTWQRVEASGNIARVITDAGVLEIVASQGTFTLERLEDACKANHKSEVLTRIALALPQGSSAAVRFEMRYRPL